jgi:hypothetical protein
VNRFQVSREPVVLVQAALVPILLLLLPLFGWSLAATDAVRVLVLAAGGFVAALGVSTEAALPLVMGLSQAGVSAALAFGWNIPTVWQTFVFGFASVVIGLFTRTQVTAITRAVPVLVPVQRAA